MGEPIHFDGNALKVSKYFHRFQRLLESHPGAMALRGDYILVEKLPHVELKTKSGIIIGTSRGTHKTTMEDSVTEFGLVLMTGPGQYIETDGEPLHVPCDSKPGDVILLPSSTAWYSAFGHIADYEPYSIGRLRDAQVPMWFDDYQLAFKVLNEIKTL